jgi:hypothetical protein
MLRSNLEKASRLLLVTLSAMALLASLSAEGQRVFKYVMPDGSIVYSDKAIPGGRLEGEIAPPPAPATEPRAASVPNLQGSEVDKRIAARRAALERAISELDAANAALAEAQHRLEAERAPLPEELRGRVGGPMGLGEQYESRQASNERAVAEARARVERAQAQLNAARY